MATLAELKARIIAETNRDDMGTGGELETVLSNAIARAIEFHADEQFWFNRKSGSASTVASTATVALPTGLRIANVVSHNQSPLQKVALEEIEHLTTTGPPGKWAENEGLIQLSPIPDAVYALKVTGIADLGVPASSNEWTTEAYDLIAATVRKILFRDVLRDVEGYNLARMAEEEELSKLRRESRRRGRTQLVGDIPVPGGFNIVTG